MVPPQPLDYERHGAHEQARYSGFVAQFGWPIILSFASSTLAFLAALVAVIVVVISSDSVERTSELVFTFIISPLAAFGFALGIVALACKR